MESKPLVFETPDPPQSIEEINAALQAKAPAKGLSGIESGNTELKVNEIFRFFEDLTSAPPKVQYRRDTPAPLPISEKLVRLQEELKELQGEANIDPESKMVLDALQQQIEGLRGLNSSTEIRTEPIDDFVYQESDFSSGITFQLKIDSDMISQTDALNVAELEIEIRRLEKLIGVRQTDTPVNLDIYNLNTKLNLLDPVKLDAVESQAKSLGNELDMLTSSKTEFSLEAYALEALRDLSVLEFPDLLEVAEKLAVCGPMHEQNLSLASSIAKLEQLADSILEIVDEDAEVLEELRLGIRENAAQLGLR